jgi:hypothetical protein
LLDCCIFVLSGVIGNDFLEGLIPSDQGVDELAGAPFDRGSVMHCLGEALTMILFECLDQLVQWPSLLSLRQELIDNLDIRWSFDAELRAQSTCCHTVTQ